MHVVMLFKPSENVFIWQLALGGKCLFQTNKTISSERKKNKQQQYRALFYDDNTRVFVSFLLLFLLTIDALKLGLRGAQTNVSAMYCICIHALFMNICQAS